MTANADWYRKVFPDDAEVLDVLARASCAAARFWRGGPNDRSTSHRAVVDRIVEEGRFWVSTTLYDGRLSIRAALDGFHTRRRHVGALVDALDRARTKRGTRCTRAAES